MFVLIIFQPLLKHFSFLEEVRETDKICIMVLRSQVRHTLFLLDFKPYPANVENMFKKIGKVHPFRGTEALYRTCGP